MQQHARRLYTAWRLCLSLHVNRVCVYVCVNVCVCTCVNVFSDRAITQYSKAVLKRA